MPPDQYFTRLFNDEGQRIGHDEGTKPFRHRGRRIKDGREKHQHGGDDANGLPNVTQKYAKGCQHPGDTHGEDDQRQHYKRNENCRPVHVAVKERKGNQQYCETNEAVKESCTHGDHRQYLNREYNFFNVIDVGENQAGGAVEDLTKKTEYDHANKENYGELCFAIVTPYATPARFENLGKDKGVNHQHEHRVEERPGQPEGRALIAANHFALGHLHDELMVAPQAFHHLNNVGGMGCVRVDCLRG